MLLHGKELIYIISWLALFGVENYNTQKTLSEVFWQPSDSDSIVLHY